MRIPPLSYNLRSLWVRRSSTLLTTVSVGATVAVLAGILALEQGFTRLYTQGGRPDVAIFMRPGANAEGDSIFQMSRAEILIKETPEVALGPDGQPLAGAELYLAVRRRKLDGGETNVPIRGVQAASYALAGDRLKILEGRRPAPGNDEILVGAPLTERIANCRLGDTLVINTTPFKVAGVFAYDGPFGSEIWGDLDRMRAALNRRDATRVVARLKPGTDVAAMAARLAEDKRVPAKVQSEPEYLDTQTKALSFMLRTLGTFLGLIMGTAAVFTGTNTMLAAIASRTKEIGILVALGFRPWAVFVSFLFEAVVLGLIGGLVGCLLVIPIHGIRTGTTNFQTFTEVAFAFQVTPGVLATAVGAAMVLGLIGGLWPAWVACRRDPVESLRAR